MLKAAMCMTERREKQTLERQIGLTSRAHFVKTRGHQYITYSSAETERYTKPGFRIVLWLLWSFLFYLHMQLF